jgi:predicted DNA-binding transcriptional regulator AlpA
VPSRSNPQASPPDSPKAGSVEGLLVRSHQAPAFIGVPRSTFYVLAKREDFPRKIVLGTQTTGYLRDELRAWVVSQRRPAK